MIDDSVADIGKANEIKRVVILFHNESSRKIRTRQQEMLRVSTHCHEILGDEPNNKNTGFNRNKAFCTTRVTTTKIRGIYNRAYLRTLKV